MYCETVAAAAYCEGIPGGTLSVGTECASAASCCWIANSAWRSSFADAVMVEKPSDITCVFALLANCIFDIDPTMLPKL